MAPTFTLQLYQIQALYHPLSKARPRQVNGTKLPLLLPQNAPFLLSIWANTSIQSNKHADKMPHCKTKYYGINMVMNIKDLIPSATW